MKSYVAAFVAGALALALAGCTTMPSYQAAISDPARPQDDTKRDADRKPAEMLEFARVKPGSVVVDYIPGGGYFTRIFAKAVGPKGKVFAVTNPPPPNAATQPPILAIAADPQYGNIKIVNSVTDFTLPEKADVIWTSQNYHDLFGRRLNADITKVDKMIYDALKPGGVFVVLDHAAAAGTPIDPDDKLHRIDPAHVKKQLESSGFKFIGESKVLANPNDDHTKSVFDASIRGHTDQFIYKFQKPKK